MSGGQAFLSFANYLETQLDGSGISVNIRKDVVSTPPFLNLEAGPEELISRWISSQLCQGWLVLEELSTEPLIVTAERLMKRVVRATQDVGMIEKYDYDQTPTVQTGLMTVRITGITADMSSDQQRSKRVITWSLLSNSAA